MLNYCSVHLVLKRAERTHGCATPWKAKWFYWSTVSFTWMRNSNFWLVLYTNVLIVLYYLSLYCKLTLALWCRKIGVKPKHSWLIHSHFMILATWVTESNRLIILLTYVRTHKRRRYCEDCTVWIRAFLGKYHQLTCRVLPPGHSSV